MGRIRTIKPEFPQSETVGNLSRDARLLFILLWTIVDDEGRTRAASRMLASLLYPYDTDAVSLIDGWLDELENGEHIRRYVVDKSTYLDIPKWKLHQRIDKPSTSKFPPFEEGSTTIPRNLQEPSHTEGTLEGNRKGKDMEGTESKISPVSKKSKSEILDQAVLMWNEVAAEKGLPLVQRMTASRISHLNARLSECNGLEGWPVAMAKVRDSPFLTGDNKTAWRADFDFVLQQSSFTKLMEGKYDGQKSSVRPGSLEHNIGVVSGAIDQELARARAAQGSERGSEPSVQSLPGLRQVKS